MEPTLASRIPVIHAMRSCLFETQRCVILFSFRASEPVGWGGREGGEGGRGRERRNEGRGERGGGGGEVANRVCKSVVITHD